MRAVVALVLGVAVAMAMLVAVEGFSALVHPFPADFRGTHEEICAHVERYPAWVLAVVVPLWAGVAFVSVLVAKVVGRSPWPARIVAVLLVVALGMNLWMLPYPAWFKVVEFLAICAAVTPCARPSVSPVGAATSGRE